MTKAEFIIKYAEKTGMSKKDAANAVNAFFRPLEKLGAEFGYRSASEIMSFCGFYITQSRSLSGLDDLTSTASRPS